MFQNVKTVSDFYLLRHLFRHTFYKALMQIVVTFLFSIYFFIYLPPLYVGLWMVLQLGNYFWRFWLVSVIKRRFHDDQATHALVLHTLDTLMRKYNLSAALSGILWGALGFFLFYIPTEHHFIVMSLVIGFTFASIFSVISVLNLFPVYTLPMNLSIWYFLSLSYDDETYASIVFLVLFIIAYVYAWKASVEYKDLHKKLIEEKLHTQRLLKTVQRENANKENYIKAIDTIGIGTLVVDPNGIIIETNETITRWFGDIVSWSIETFFQNIAGMTPSNYVKELQTKDGKYYEIAQTRIALQNGHVHRLYVFKDVTKEALQKKILHKMTLQYKQKSEHDALTGFYNKETFLEHLEKKLYEANRTFSKLALLFIDIDGFKAINDRFGHTSGDRILKIIAQRIRKHIPSEAILGRYGGDEFLAAFLVTDDVIAVEKIASAIVRIMEKPFKVQDTDVVTSVSIGIALYPQDALESTTLIQKADEAMYIVKHEHKNGFLFFHQRQEDAKLIR